MNEMYGEWFFGRLFDHQMIDLKLGCCPTNILEFLESKKQEVVNKATKMEIPTEHIPFVPVIPRNCIKLWRLYNMFFQRYGKMVRFDHQDQKQIRDIVKTPKIPYFIYDVKKGKDMLGKSSREVEKLIKEQKRSCLTADEGIALCFHYNGVLFEHSVICGSSCCRYDNFVISISPDPIFDGLNVRMCHIDNSWDRGGSPSCSSRL